MTTFKDIINEAKQIGTVFHFTKLKSAIMMLNDGEIKTSAATGQLNKSVDEEGKNNISMSRNYGGSGDIVKDFGSVRIAFDGNKISNKYKIKPFMDSENFITREIGKWEEQVRAKSLSLDKYVVRVDILQDSKFDYGEAMKLAETWRKKGYKFKVYIVNKFLPVKRQDKNIVNEFK